MDRVLFFRDLGFSEYEARVLACLVKLQTANAKEISLDSGVPQNKIYSVLRKFEEMGILSALPGEPKEYRLINLEGFIRERVKEKEDKLGELRKGLKDLGKMNDKEEHGTFLLIKG